MTAMLEGVRNNPVLRQKLFQIDYLTTPLSNQAVVSLLYPKSWTMPGVSKRRRCVTPLRAQGLNVASDWAGDQNQKSSSIKII